MLSSSNRPRSWKRRKVGLDLSFNVKLFADLLRRPCRRRKERRVLELIGLLDDLDQRRGFSGDARDLQLAVGHMQFGQIGIVRQGLRERLEDNDGRRRFALLLRQLRRRFLKDPLAPAQKRDAPFGHLMRDLKSRRIELGADKYPSRECG